MEVQFEFECKALELKSVQEEKTRHGKAYRITSSANNIKTIFFSSSTHRH